MTIPPPVVCLTCPAASPTTRKFSDQHLSTGPDTRTDPDFVASTLDFGQWSLTSSSSSFFTLPFRHASPTRALWSPVGMLHAKNPERGGFRRKARPYPLVAWSQLVRIVSLGVVGSSPEFAAPPVLAVGCRHRWRR